MANLPKIRLTIPCAVIWGLVTFLSPFITALEQQKSFGLPVCLDNTTGSGNESCIIHDSKMKLIYATQHEIISMESDGKVAKILKTNPTGIPHFVTSDTKTNVVFWSDLANYEEAVYKTDMNIGSNEPPNIFVDSNVFTPAGVAFDWVTNNLYIVDTNLTYIAVCSQNPANCVVIFRDSTSRPLDIALYPQDGVMFWTDIGLNAGIKKSSMDGSETETIITTSNGSLPHGIAVDELEYRIYWTDTGARTIESSNFDGSDRKTIKISIDAFDVEILGDLIFWSDSTTRKIMSANKVTGADETEVVAEYSATTLAGFTLMHVMKQMMTRTNSCEFLECAYICVLAKSEAVCLCPEGMLSNSSHCYTNINEPSLLLAHEDKLVMMEVDKVGENVFVEVPVPSEITNIGAMVFNPINMTVIVSDVKLRQIVEIERNVGRPSSYSVLIDGISNVSHIAIDLVAENIMWFDQGKGTLEVMSLRSRCKTVVLSNLSNVHDIYFASDIMALFISKTGENGYEEIFKIVFGGGIRQTKFHTYDQYTSPIQLSYDYSTKQLDYVFGNDTDVIVNGFNNDSTEFLVGTYSGGGAPTDFLTRYHKIFWVDNTSNLRVLTSNGEEWLPHKIRINDSSEHDFTGKKLLTLLDRNTDHLEYLRANHDCSPSNPKGKNCKHICVSVGIGMLGECLCENSDDDSLSACITHTFTTTVKPAQKKIKTVSYGFVILITVVTIVLGGTIVYLAVVWWKTRSLPIFITESYARFFDN